MQKRSMFAPDLIGLGAAALLGGASGFAGAVTTLRVHRAMTDRRLARLEVGMRAALRMLAVLGQKSDAPDALVELVDSLAEA